MGTVLELKNCVKGLREFLYTHLNIKRFNMFTAWEKYRPDCTIILCTITGGTERSASKALEVLILPATRLNSSSKLKPTWLASHSHRHILCLCYSFKKWISYDSWDRMSVVHLWRRNILNSYSVKADTWWMKFAIKIFGLCAMRLSHVGEKPSSNVSSGEMHKLA